jgi:predicted nucleic acid-binding protein
MSDEQIRRFVDELGVVCAVVPTPATIPRWVEEDPKDDVIIATALQSGAGYIVSEDRHLLKLREFRGIRIMTRDELATELDRLAVP